LIYLPLFVWYGIGWFVLLPKYRDRMTAYRHQHDPTYLEKRKHYHYLT